MEITQRNIVSYVSNSLSHQSYACLDVTLLEPS
jgi:hypothetical protein